MKEDIVLKILKTQREYRRRYFADTGEKNKEKNLSRNKETQTSTELV